MTSNVRPVSSGILILDYGSQYTLLIARRFRELGIYSEIIDGTAKNPPVDFDVRGIVLSGGPDSVYESTGRKLPEWVLTKKVPVLGVCYGMQLLVNHFGGKVRGATKREYGRAQLVLSKKHTGPGASVCQALAKDPTVWMSHGDDIENSSHDFEVEAQTSDGVIAAIAHKTLPLVALQFHPEVEHTICGRELLREFAYGLCGMKSNWQTSDMVQTSIDSIKQVVGNGHVLVACSGGVDSTVAAAIMLKALGPKNVTAVFCDTGLMRKNEVPWVAENLKKLGLVNLEVLQSSDLFFKSLAGVTDPEEKRKVIGRLFISEFEKFAKQKNTFTHLGQGTLYPDVIESAGHGSGSQVIKSHHNVGGLPDKLHLPLVEPFRFLFKDEVRKIGDAIGLPKELVYRHPFPGPGLAVRILGEITKERADLLREADAVFIESLRSENLYDTVWQAFAVLLPVKTVGVMGDNRTYQYTAALRTVNSSDGMTADVGRLPMDFLIRVADKIVRSVPGINRIVYDVTSKPPATIEWE